MLSVVTVVSCLSYYWDFFCLPVAYISAVPLQVTMLLFSSFLLLCHLFDITYSPQDGISRRVHQPDCWLTQTWSLWTKVPVSDFSFTLGVPRWPLLGSLGRHSTILITLITPKICFLRLIQDLSETKQSSSAGHEGFWFPLRIGPSHSLFGKWIEVRATNSIFVSVLNWFVCILSL